MSHAMLDVEVAASPKERPAAANVSGSLSVALVGAGFIAESHLAVLRQLGGVEVIGLCDPNSERAEALARKWNIGHVARNLAELIAARKPDVVHILVPPPLHFDVAREALTAGVHVFVEKPLALRSAEGKELIGLARRHGLTLGVNHNWLHNPLYQRLQRDLATYRLGAISHVVSTHNLPLRQFLVGEHDHWMFREPQNILFEQAVHPLSQICDLLGPVEQVQTTCSNEQRLRNGKLFPTRWQLALVCACGTAQVYLAFGRSFPESRVDVIGQDGAAHLDLLNNIYYLDRRTKYFDAIDRLLRCLRQGRRAAWCGIGGSVRYGLSTLRLTGRNDPFYLGMRDSIQGFYQELRAGNIDNRSAAVGQLVIEGLEKACEPPMQCSRGSGAEFACPTALLASRERKRPEEQSANVAHAPISGEIAVLGGAGFIGRRLVAALTDAGVPVRVMTRQPTQLEMPGDSRPSICTGDIRNADDVRRAVQGCRAVIHLVSGAPATWPEFEKLFIDGTRHVAEACLEARIPQLLFVSSIAAYYLGRAHETITEQTPLDPRPHRRALYARAKIACERLLLDLHRTRGLPVTIFRPGVVVGVGGPLEHSGVGFWASGTDCVSWGCGIHRSLPFVLADDVASALVSALGKENLAGKSLNLVGDVRLSAAEYIDLLRAEGRRDFSLHRQSLVKSFVIDVVKWAVKAAARKPGNAFPSWRDLKTRSLAAPFDCTLAKDLLDWRPVADRAEFIERGIREMIRGSM
jgi:predicted dehydrogenase/nucleoside-diphosphate-sugar epimerase